MLEVGENENVNLSIEKFLVEEIDIEVEQEEVVFLAPDSPKSDDGKFVVRIPADKVRVVKQPKNKLASVTFESTQSLLKMGVLKRLEDPLLTWADIKKTATVFGAGNAVLLAFLVEFPIIVYTIQYGGYLLLFAGFLASRTGMVNTEDIGATTEKLAASIESGVAAAIHTGLTPAVKAVAPIALWVDLQTSGLVLCGLYVFASVVELFGLLFLTFLMFNFLFLYGKFQDQIIPAAQPLMAQAQEGVMKVFEMIPKYEKGKYDGANDAATNGTNGASAPPVKTSNKKTSAELRAAKKAKEEAAAAADSDDADKPAEKVEEN